MVGSLIGHSNFPLCDLRLILWPFLLSWPCPSPFSPSHTTFWPWPICLTLWINYLPYCSGKTPAESNLKEAGVTLIRGLRVLTVMTGCMASGAWSRWSHLVCSQEAERDENWSPPWLFFLIPCAIPDHSLVQVTFKVCLLFPAKHHWECPHRHTRRCVSWGIPYLVPPTVKFKGPILFYSRSLDNIASITLNVLGNLSGSQYLPQTQLCLLSLS